MGFRFTEPLVLFVLMIIPVIYYFYRRYQHKKKKSSLKFSTLKIVKKAKPQKTIRKHIPFILLLIIISLIITGLADPHIPLKRAKKGVNVVLVVDDSGSMQAKDYKPTRLEAAKKAAIILVKSLKEKDNIGVVIFESGATTAAYLTPFKEKVIQKIENIQSKKGKTAIGDGLSLGIDMATSIPNKKNVVILLSDGVNNAGVIKPDKAVEFAKSENIQVYTIGMGSEEKVVLGYDFFGNPQYAELDEETLKNIARETKAKYYKSIDEHTLEEIYSRIGKNIKRELEDTSIKDWFFIAALIILLINIYIIYGKYRIVI